jgi:hypothetical protein
MKKLLSFLLLFCHQLLAQEFQSSKFQFSGYIEAYYNYDFNQPQNHLRPDFLYNFTRHNEFSINLAVLKASYEDEHIRANLAIMGGTYAQFNLSDEPTWAQMLNEVSVGVKLHQKLWLDLGIMPSHIGFESWYGMDCWHLSRSLLAENSPYFLTGARFSYTLSERTDIQFWLANGWQNVQRNPRNQSLAIGLGINHRPIEGLVINYANFFGNENPQPLRLNRFFNNFYAQYEKNEWGITLGADYGIEASPVSNLHQWFGLTASLRRQLADKFFVAGRAEYYSDPTGIILNEGLKVSGLSANLDYQVNRSALARIELRQFMSPDAIFSLPEAKFSKGNTALTGSLAVRF